MTKYNWNERHIITFPEEKLALSTKDLHVYYGQKEAIKGIDMQFEKNKITALIGPSGCGKSTFLRSLNRMNDTIDIDLIPAARTLYYNTIHSFLSLRGD